MEKSVMWKVKTRPGKVVVSHPGVPSSLVIKIRREIELVPRWKVASAQTLAAFMAAMGLAHGAVIAGGIMAALAVFLTWAASR